jgi:geranylgeranyl diphosphate synthase type I
MKKVRLGETGSAEFAKEAEQMAELVDEEMVKLIAAEPDYVSKHLRYLVELGGRRIRSALALYVCKMLGGGKEDVLRFAVSLQLAHNAALLQDDLIDRSSVRRGQPTAYKKFGEDSTIVSGTFWYLKAVEYLVENEDRPDALKAYLELLCEVNRHQALDLELRDKEFDSSSAEKLVEMKADANFIMPVKLACIYAGKNDDGLLEYAEKLGRAYIIKDYLIDMDDSESGKDGWLDLKNGTQNPIYVDAYEKLSEADRKEFMEGFRAANVHEIKKFLEHTGSVEHYKGKMNQYAQEAYDIAARYDSGFLQQLAKYASDRVR